MVKRIEHLGIEAERDSFSNGERLRDVNIGVRVIGPRTELRPEFPNWHMAGLSGLPGVAPVQSPIVGSTTETNASGFSHCLVPATVTPGYGVLRYMGTPGTRLAYSGALNWTVLAPFARKTPPVGDIRLAEHAERQSGVQESRLRERPSTKHLPQHGMFGVERYR